MRQDFSYFRSDVDSFDVQLRNMLGSATAFEHYFVTSNRIMQYNSISDEIHEVCIIQSPSQPLTPLLLADRF